MHVDQCVVFATECCGTRVVFVFRADEELIERTQATFIAAGSVLSVHLLQTQYVGIKPIERGTEHCRAKF